MNNNYLFRTSSVYTFDIYSINPAYTVNPTFTNLMNYYDSEYLMQIYKIKDMSLNDDNLIAIVTDSSQFWLINITSGVPLLPDINTLSFMPL